MKIINRLLATLFLGVWGILFAMHTSLHIKGRNFNFQSVPQDKVILNFIAACIVFVGGGVAAFFIAKKYNAEKPYNAVLATLAVMSGALGIKWLIGF